MYSQSVALSGIKNAVNIYLSIPKVINSYMDIDDVVAKVRSIKSYENARIDYYKPGTPYNVNNLEIYDAIILLCSIRTVKSESDLDIPIGLGFANEAMFAISKGIPFIILMIDAPVLTFYSPLYLTKDVPKEALAKYTGEYPFGFLPGFTPAVKTNWMKLGRITLNNPDLYSELKMRQPESHKQYPVTEKEAFKTPEYSEEDVFDEI